MTSSDSNLSGFPEGKSRRGDCDARGIGGVGYDVGQPFSISHFPYVILALQSHMFRRHFVPVLQRKNEI